MQGGKENSYPDVFRAATYVKPLGCVHVDMSLSPKERWRRAMEESKSFVDVDVMIAETRKHVDDLLGLVSFIDVSSSTKSWTGLLLRGILFTFFGVLCVLFCEYSSDIAALASLLRIPKGELFLANVIYETFGCTSFICNDKSDAAGRPMLARTLDWPFTELAKYTLHFRWLRNDKVIFESIGWMGFVGVMTGVKPGCFAIALNARYPDIPEFQWVDRISERVSTDIDERKFISYALKSFLRKLGSMCYLSAWCSGSSIRHCLEHCESYADVVAQLSRRRLVAPCYFIIAGVQPKEGVVLSRDVWPMKDTPLLTMLQEYVVQTNHDIIDEDHTAGLPPEDFNSFDRYQCVCHLLQKQPHLTPTEAATILTKSINSGVGVRMKMTLYCCIMRPHSIDAPIFAAKMSRCIGQ